MDKFVKQVLVSLALFLVVFSSIQQVSAAGFKDVSNFKEEIKYLTGLKIINGYPDGTYRPEAPILRVQAVMMIMRDLGMDKENIKNPGFTDIKPGDMGYAEVAFATELGIISGKGITNSIRMAR
ncbi:S-layer homology domain-containing protein [Planococcus glaciei]|nr:S-layer homology domain-containing protein [Planococcus glaciei]QDY46797.1 S-layer homology domain-containing protein [Planococcus glaciei]